MILASAIFGTSCLSDLDVKPLDPNLETGDVVYSKKESYINGLMKIYSVFAMSGQDGAGSSDVEGLDAGNAQLYRALWNLQVVSTDECVNAWPDQWVPEINEMKWTTTANEAVNGVYLRCMFIVAVTNDYLKETTVSKMASRGMDESFIATVQGYRAEARLLRAMAYQILLDTYGYPPFITEENYSETPSQLSRAELFDWIESEIKAVAEGSSTEKLPEARTSYGRVDKGVAYSLLARLYLNAEVYTGTERYTDCITACNNVIASGYSLAPDYANLFKADNDKTSASEIIFPIVYDGTKTQTYGGIRFLIASSRSPEEVSVATDGSVEGWSGNRALPTIVKKFEFADNNNPTAATIKDKRGIFKDTNRSLEIEDWLKTFETQGWSIYKWTNLKSDGTPGSNQSSPDTDIPFIRLAEIYLTYAEAVKRGGQGGSEATALKYINDLRKRGYGDDSGKISNFGSIDLDFILDERARELYWEATRRTDLIRYGYFTSDKYKWPFKGGSKVGTAVPEYMNIYPIPTSDTSVNPNLVQNKGYED